MQYGFELFNLKMAESGSLMCLFSCLHVIAFAKYFCCLMICLACLSFSSSSTVNGKVAASYTVHMLILRGYAGLHCLCVQSKKDFIYLFIICFWCLYVFVWCVPLMTNVNRPLNGLLAQTNQKKLWGRLQPHQSNLDRICRPRLRLHSGLAGPTSQTLAQALSASSALWRCSGMHRMLVMPVSFVRQTENGTCTHNPLNHKNIRVCHRGKKKIPSVGTINRSLPH